MKPNMKIYLFFLSKHHSLGYTHPATPGEYLEPDVTPKIAALDVTNLATKEVPIPIRKMFLNMITSKPF